MDLLLPWRSPRCSASWQDMYDFDHLGHITNGNQWSGRLSYYGCLRPFSEEQIIGADITTRLMTRWRRLCNKQGDTAEIIPFLKMDIISTSLCVPTRRDIAE